MTVLHNWKDVRTTPFHEFVQQNAPGKILVKRMWGAIGDTLCARLIYEDIKTLCGEQVELIVAVPQEFHDLVRDHPYIDGLIDYRLYAAGLLDEEEYICEYDISQSCGYYERLKSPHVDKHRADIWAEHSVGVTLKNHYGHLRFAAHELKNSKEILDEMPKGFKVGLGVFTSTNAKDWTGDAKKMKALCEGVFKMGAIPVILHNLDMPYELPGYVQHPKDLSLRSWLALCAQLDAMVVSATSHFHASQLVYRPTVAVFGPEDLSVYGKYHTSLEMVWRHAKGEKTQMGTPGEWDKTPPGLRDWRYCPCWNHYGCWYKADKHEMPPECLKDIQPEEVLDALATVVNKCREWAPEQFDSIYYQKIGKAWFTDSPDRQLQHEAFIETVGLNGVRRVLDLGCGRALGILALRAQGATDVVGVDFSPWACENGYASVQQEDLRLFDTTGYDLVICRNSLECVKDTDILPLFESVRSRMPADGRFVLSVLTIHEWQRRKDNGEDDPSRVTIREDTWWINRLQLAGFDVSMGRMDGDNTVLVATPTSSARTKSLSASTKKKAESSKSASRARLFAKGIYG